MSNADEGFHILADGTGGRAGGKTAANLAIDAISKELSRGLRTKERPDVLMANAICRAHEIIREHQKKDVGVHAMATTVVVLVCRADKLYLAHVGDSRAYRFNDSGLEQLTRDHSYANYLADNPSVRPKSERPGNMLMRALGTGEEAPEPELRTVPFAAGDVFLACSDGISAPLPDWVMAAILGGVGDLSEEACASALVRSAMAHGSMDNLSAVVLRAQPPRSERAGLLGWLAFIEGPDQGRVISLGETTVVGKDEACDVVIKDGFISDKHAQIKATGRGFLIKDLSSRNGTFLNEQRIREEALSDSDLLRFGGSTVMFKAHRVAP